MAEDVLVTGATGLIGRRLVQALAGLVQVHALSRAQPDWPDGVAAIHADLRDPDFVRSLPGRVDTVVHLAQSPRFREFPDGALDVFDVNVGSTVRLLDYAQRAGATRFVLASSGGIYGHGDAGFKEDDDVRPSQPLGFYLGTKQSAEILTGTYDRLVTVVLRFFFVYGPEQRKDMLIPRLVRSVREGTEIVLQGEDGIRLNPVHVSDAVAAVQAAMSLERSAQVNVAGPEVLTLRQLAETIGRACGREPRFRIESDVEPRHLVGDVRRMIELLVEPTRRFADAVSELCR